MFVQDLLCLYKPAHYKRWPNVEYFFSKHYMIALTYNFIHPSDPTAHIIEYFHVTLFFWSQPAWHTNCNQGQSGAQRAGCLLTTGFKNSAMPSHCCWQEISARHWCAEQELIWSGLLQLNGTGPEVMHYGKRGDNFSHSFLQFSAVDLEHLCWIPNHIKLCFSMHNITQWILCNLNFIRQYFCFAVFDNIPNYNQNSLK